MSVLIRGMSGYGCCADCEFCGGLIMPDGIYTCDCPPTRGMNITRAIEEDCKSPDCQLVELPEKHGRLIDADAYVSMMEGKCDYEKALDPYVLSVCRGGIKLMPTIVEAEGAEGE